MSKEKSGTLLILRDLIDQYISRAQEIFMENDNCHGRFKNLLLDFAGEITPPNTTIGIMEKIKGGKQCH